MMMYINLIWAWGHPEVYILVLPVFGVFSEIAATFSRKRLFGYTSLVWATVCITVLSFIVWLHHFFTMGAGANVNAFFGITTMIIAIYRGEDLQLAVHHVSGPYRVPLSDAVDYRLHRYLLRRWDDRRTAGGTRC